MDINTLMSVVWSIDQNSVILMVMISGCATWLVREILDTTTWFAIFTFPVLLGASVLGMAVAKMNDLFISADMSVNTVIAAVGGMIILFALGTSIFRLMSWWSEKSVQRPYLSRNTTKE